MVGADLAPHNVSNKENNLNFPFSQRWGMAFWNLAFLRDRRFAPDPVQSAAVNRGAYLATALGHCGECHTPRNRRAENAIEEVPTARGAPTTPSRCAMRRLLAWGSCSSRLGWWARKSRRSACGTRFLNGPP